MKGMLRKKSVFLFLLIFSSVYLVFIIPHTGLDHLYCEFISSRGNRIFSNFRKDLLVNCSCEDRNSGNNMILLLEATYRQYGIVRNEKTLNIHLDGFLPFAFLISLIIATPIGWRRKAISIFIGIIIMYAMVIFRIRINIIQGLSIIHNSINDSEPPFYFTNSQLKINNFIFRHFIAPVNSGFIFALFLWLILCFRKKELQKFAGIIDITETDKKSNHKVRAEIPVIRPSK
jgi:hypothetical protein